MGRQEKFGKLCVFFTLLLCLAGAPSANGQQQDESLRVRSAIAQLYSDSRTLYLALKNLTEVAVLKPAETYLYQVAQDPKHPFHHASLSELVGPDKSPSILLWPYQLTAQSKHLLDLWIGKEKNVAVQKHLEANVLSSYWRSRIVVYLYIESLRVQHFYKNAPRPFVANSKSEQSLKEDLDTLHQLNQQISQTTRKLLMMPEFYDIVKAQLKRVAEWNPFFDRYYHYGLEINFQSRTPLSSWNRYFHPYRWAAIRNQNKTQSPTTPLPNPVPTTPKEKEKNPPFVAPPAEPEFVKSNPKLQRLILRLQALVVSNEFAYDEEVERLYQAFKAEIPNNKSEIHKQLEAVLQNGKAMERETLQQKTQVFLQTLRPGLPGLRPRPSLNWGWDPKKGLYEIPSSPESKKKRGPIVLDPLTEPWGETIRPPADERRT